MDHRLGIIDWGIGGISLYKLIGDEIRVPVTYFSDTGVTPYGKMGRGELSSRLDTVIDWLNDRGATHILIGCNAASTAIPALRPCGLPLLGVIEPAIKAAVRARPASLGLIGGRRTVVSGAYREPLNERGVVLKQRVAQPLSGMIESGDVSSAGLRLESERILRPLRNCSHILLACTHYPAIADTLKLYVSKDTKFIDPAASVIKELRQWKLTGLGDDEFFTTGDPSSMVSSAKAAFGVDLPRVESVTA